jgi:TonB-linked SusC/RagA family outer membrane protein
MKHILLLLVLALSAFGQSALAQGRVVQGTVTDRLGAVPGVAVYEKDLTANGTATDVDGKYRLALKGKSGILIFRSVNYKLSEVQVGNRTTVNVLMESTDQKLDEVTVVGFGEQQKITQTGSVSQISGKEIRENPSASLQNTLVGKLPGFFSQQPSGRPGADGAAFFIRGISSYNNNNQPLIIVDDIQYSYDQFQRLDPNEIESLSILKDAATTAIYGVRGANGVVVITTRRGKDGPPQISGRVEVGFSQPTKITNYLDAAESARLYNIAQVNDNPTATPRFSEQDLELYRNGKDPYGHPNVNWRKELFRDWTQQYRGNIDMSGGSQRVKYFVSVGYLYQNGILKDFGTSQGVNSNYYHQRYNYRSNLDINVTTGLDARVDLYGNFAQVNNPNVGSPFGYNDLFYDYSSFATLAPFAYPITNPDGSWGYSKWSRDVNSGFNQNNVIGRLTNFGYSRNNENNINTVLSLKEDFGKLSGVLTGLSLTGRAAYTSNYTYTRSMTRDAFPSFIFTPDQTALNRTPPNYNAGDYEARDPNLFRTRRFFIGYNSGTTTRVLNLQAILNYDRTFAEAHHVYGLALYNRNANTANNGDVIYRFIPNNFLGYSMRLGYDYKNRYLFQFNAGYNGSDRFNENNRYGLFPAVSAGWNIAEENFFKNTVPVVDYLKLRGSYGIVGNDVLDPRNFTYYYQQNYTGGGGYDFGQNSTGYNGILEGRLANNNVTWETEKKLDIALEFRLFKDKLFGSVDFFNNDRYDILTNRGTVSTIFGQGLPPVNLGRVNNRGYELELGFQSPLSRDFSWNIKANYSFAKNKILFQDEPNPQYDYQRYTGNSIGQQRVYVYQGFYSAADITNASVAKPATGARAGDLKYQDVNGDGVLNDFDRVVTGLPNLPNTTYGVTLGARYKNFSFSVLFQGASNFNVSAAAEAIKAFTANLTSVHQQAWTPDLGDNAKYPRLTLLSGISDPTANQSTFWQIRGDYLRLKTAQINFDLPTSWLRHVGIPGARLYANGTNLLTWTVMDKLYDFDPEITLGASRTLYPPQRLINFGLSVTF